MNDSVNKHVFNAQIKNSVSGENHIDIDMMFYDE